MSDTCLTDEEVERYTRPLVQGKARCNYFERVYKVKVRARPDGQPIVGRAEFEAAMMSKGRVSQPVSHSSADNVVAVDFEAMSQVRSRRKPVA